jgi:hypothetical protein
MLMVFTAECAKSAEENAGTPILVNLFLCDLCVLCGEFFLVLLRPLQLNFLG